MVLNYLPKTILRGTSQENVLDLLRSSACQLAKCSYSKSEAVTSSQPEYEINKPDAHRSCSDYADVKWDDLGFGHVPVDYMYVMKCSRGKSFSRGEITPYRGIELSPFSGVINYGQGLFEGLKAYQRVDGEGIMLFRPQENALRMQTGAERMCMPSLSVEQFVDAVKQLVSANKRWVPPPGKGSLYVRPLLLGTGPLLGLAPAPEYTFLTYASPVGNYFKESVASISLLVDNETHRATPGGTGGVKTISNYGPVLKSQMKAKKEGYSDVLFLDSVEKKYIEESSACNIFIVKDNVISTPATRGTILAGVTRKSIIEIARDSGYQVEERSVLVDELADADEVFCTGTAIGVPEVGSISYNGQRYKYRTGETTISQKLHKALSGIQTGLIEDKMGWTITIE